MNIALPVQGVVPTREMVGDDDEDTGLLEDMLLHALSFIASFSWCKRVTSSYFGCGVGGVVAIFFFHLEPSGEQVDEWLWVITGDVPPAYLVIDHAKTPIEALDIYVGEMKRWVKYARKGQTSDDVIPVNAPATPEWAELLNRRLDTLTKTIRPALIDRM